MPYCQRAVPLLERVAAKYPEQVRIVYRHLPLEGLHPQARAGAEAAACAAAGGRFWEYHDLLFANPRALGDADLRRYAEEVGLDAKAFDACLSSRQHAAAIDADMREASAVGVTGTPAFVVNGIVLFGLQSEEALDKVIREELRPRRDLRRRLNALDPAVRGGHLLGGGGMFGMGAMELLVILGIVVVLFGARRLPELGSGVGKAIRNFKAGISGKDELDVTPKKDEVTEGERPK